MENRRVYSEREILANPANVFAWDDVGGRAEQRVLETCRRQLWSDTAAPGCTGLPRVRVDVRVARSIVTHAKRLCDSI